MSTLAHTSANPATVGWGVVGCGWLTRDHLLPGLASAEGAQLIGAYDTDPAAAQRAAGDGFAATDLAALLEQPGLHAVYVATPNAAHRPAVTAVAAAGIPVLCEKPLAADLADAQAMVDACAGLLAGIAFDQRFHPAHVRIAELIRAGELGTVTAVRIAYGCWLPSDWSPDGLQSDNWRIDRRRAGGGALIDLAPHGLDLVGALTGDDVETLSIQLQRRVHGYEVDDGAVLAGRTAGGVLFGSHVSYNTPDALPRRRLEIVGTRAQVIADDTMGQTAGGRLQLIDANTGDSRDVPFDSATSPFTVQLEAFGAAVLGRRPWPWPMERDLALHTLLWHAYEAADDLDGRR